jgi:hypothetical protein
MNQSKQYKAVYVKLLGTETTLYATEDETGDDYFSKEWNQ